MLPPYCSLDIMREEDLRARRVPRDDAGRENEIANDDVERLTTQQRAQRSPDGAAAILRNVVRVQRYGVHQIVAEFAGTLRFRQTQRHTIRAIEGGGQLRM